MQKVTFFSLLMYKKKEKSNKMSLVGRSDDPILSRFTEYPFEDFLAREVANKALGIVDAGGDGHCFFYSVIRCIAEKCMFKNIPEDLSDEMKKAVDAIGHDVVNKFRRSGSYVGEPRDTVNLYSAVLGEMNMINSTTGCMKRVDMGLQKAEKGERAQGSAFADIEDCGYAQAVSNLFGICVAIEYDLGTGDSADATKWRVFRPRPGDPYHSRFDMTLHANGTKTPMRDVADIRDAIYMKLHQSHFQSYVYPNDLVRKAQMFGAPPRTKRTRAFVASVLRSARYT